MCRRRPILEAQEASFKEFLSRPENQEVMEKQQRKEAKQAIQLQEKMRALEFREKASPGAAHCARTPHVDRMGEAQHKATACGQTSQPAMCKAASGMHKQHISPSPVSACQPCCQASCPPCPDPAGLQVLDAEYDAQKNIAPFLENRVLRRIVQVGANQRAVPWHGPERQGWHGDRPCRQCSRHGGAAAAGSHPSSPPLPCRPSPTTPLATSQSGPATPG